MGSQLHNNRVGDFCKRIKSQQLDLAKKILVRCEVQFSKKKWRNEAIKNEANQCQFFLENQILLRDRIFLRFIYSEKATKFCKIFPLLLITVHTVKSKGKISQNFVAFSEYMNFKGKKA